MGGPGWRDRLDPTLERGPAAEKLFRETLKSVGNFDFVVSTKIDKATTERPHFFITYGTKSLEGLKVFRQTEYDALRQHEKNRANANPIVLPPGQPIKPTHPIYIHGPGPSHPIVEVPPGTDLAPAHPIHIPAPCPGHPIAIPPGSALVPSHPIEIPNPGDPEHPIVLPPGQPVYPAHPIVIVPPDQSGVGPAHPIQPTTPQPR